jgi:hypothetical protein
MRREGHDSMGNDRRDESARLHRRGPRRRALAFERLDIRAVLSATNPLAMGFAVDAGHFDSQPPGNNRGLDGAIAGHRPIHELAPSPSFGTSVRGGDAGDPLPSGGSGHRSGHAPPPSPVAIVPAAIVFDTFSPGFGTPVWIVTVATWNAPVLRGPPPGFGWSDLVGLPDFDASPPPSAPPLPSSGLQALSVVPAFAIPGATPATPVANALVSTSSVDHAGSPASNAGAEFDAGAIAIVTSSTTRSPAIAQAPRSSASSIFVLPDNSTPSQAFDAPGRSITPDPNGAVRDALPALPLFENEGGLIEPDAQGPWASGQDHTAEPDEASTTPGRDHPESDDADSDDFWSDLLDLLDDAEEESTVEADGAIRSDRDRVVENESSTDDAVAQFDDGGMIELEPAAAVIDVVATAIADRPMPADSVDLTIDAGVALFQAFELGTGATNTQPLPNAASRPGAVPVTDDADPRAEGVEAAPDRAAVGAGLGAVVALPLAIRPGARHEKRRRVPTIRALADDSD